MERDGGMNDFQSAGYREAIPSEYFEVGVVHVRGIVLIFRLVYYGILEIESKMFARVFDKP